MEKDWITIERWDILEKMVREAFPEKKVKEQPERVDPDPDKNVAWGIRVLIPVPRRWIMLTPDEDLMWDEGVHFVQRFEEAIACANQKLSSFMEGKGLLGRVKIKSDGIEWEPAKES